MLEGHLMLGANQIYQARFLESRAHFEQVLALLPPDSGARHAFQYVGHSSAFSRSYLGRTLSFLGHYDRAVEASEQGLAVARTLAIPMSVAQAMGMHTLLYQVRGEIEPAQSWAAQTLAYATEYGLPYWSSLSSIVLGWVLAHQGQLEQGISQLRRGIDQNLSTGAKVGRSWFLVMLADMYRTQGAWEHGFDAVAQALAHAEETEERYYEAEAYRLKGELLKAQGGLAATEAAETCFRRAIAIARHQGARSWELRASTSLARLWHDTARAAEARQVLAAVYESFTEGHEVPDLQEARRMLGELTTQV